MTKRSSPSRTFTSLQILSSKAQGLLRKARTVATENGKHGKSVKLPPTCACEAITVHLSAKSALKAAFTVLAVVAGTWVVLHLRDKILLLLLGVFVAMVIDPGVAALERKLRIPRGIAILVHYVVAIFLVLFLFFSLIPIVATQLQQIALFISAEVNGFLADPRIALPLLSDETNARLTLLVQNTLRDLSIYEFTDALQSLGQNLATAAEGSLRFAAQIAGSVARFVATLIIVLVLGFFIQLEKERIVRWVRNLFPRIWIPYVDAKADAIHVKIGQWARGEALLMFSIFALTLLALVILRMPYALTLALLAGFCEFIPAMGPLIAAVPAVLIALSQQGFVWAGVIAGVYYVIQWCENNLLVPLIMRRAVGLSPVAILFAMLIGVSFQDTIHPVLGVMLSIPTTTIIAIFLRDITERNA
jgi:predicted PurR-regulated permease PerM